ncbi:hypothetical protein G4B88_018400 [Cannabis sativa]|uniref:Uncharacterized protein n=1 Tax=Cannabis sativa TaxID=3483 RepID=A0A7J6DLC6_CANSA|nr:hypothetical protein G4B88_018400 [Cannabis sativa]
MPSLNRMPSPPVRLARSEPARSTKCNFAQRISSPKSSVAAVPFTIFFCSMWPEIESHGSNTMPSLPLFEPLPLSHQQELLQAQQASKRLRLHS